MSESVAASTGQTFALEHEDHTLANALRFMLNKKCGRLTCCCCCLLPLLECLTLLTNMHCMQPTRNLLRLQHATPVGRCSQYTGADNGCVELCTACAFQSCTLDILNTSFTCLASLQARFLQWRHCGKPASSLRRCARTLRGRLSRLGQSLRRSSLSSSGHLGKLPGVMPGKAWQWTERAYLLLLWSEQERSRATVCCSRLFPVSLS